MSVSSAEASISNNCSEVINGNSATEGNWIPDEMRNGYKVFHGWFATVWCTMTSISNVVTIIVLQHKAMRSTTNTLLTGVAAMHLIISLMYIPLAQILLTFQRTQSDSGSYMMASFLLILVISIITAQMCSIWMTVSVALFRYICIRFPQHSAQLCTVRSASYTVACVILSCQLLSIPAWLAHYVNEVAESSSVATGNALCSSASQTQRPAPSASDNHVQGELLDDEFEGLAGNTSASFAPALPANGTGKFGYTVMLHSGMMTTASIWINSQCGKFIPSLILCILSILLVKTMKSADKRRQRLVGKDRTTEHLHSEDSRNDKPSERGKIVAEKDDRERKTNRTTQLLLAVAIMFILSNLPQSALELTAAFNSYFRMSVYPIIGDLMDTVAQLNNGITFVIYCTMSAQFRRTFHCVFVTPITRRFCVKEKQTQKQESTRRRPPGDTNPTRNGSEMIRLSDVSAVMLSERDRRTRHTVR